MSDVFISYKREDETLCRNGSGSLLRCGHSRCQDHARNV